MAIAVAILAAAGIAHAQLPGVQLPNVQLPSLPQVQLPVDVNGRVGNLTGLDQRPLAELRRLRVRELIRANRDVLESDPRGEPVVRAEVTAFSPSDPAIERARSAGFSVTRERALPGLNARIVVLVTPRGLSTRRALARLRALDPEGAYDFNHIYLNSGATSMNAAAAAATEPANGTSPSGGTGAAGGTHTSGTTDPGSVLEAPGTRPGLRVGLIDSGVDTGHPVFGNVAIHQYGCAGKPVPSAHGTAVASLIAGKSDKFQGAAPGAELFAADVYCGMATGGAVDAVADAIGWLARERVAVVNISLVGPRNVILENVVRVVIARGYVIVAAVGNDGPAAPPLYPAAYPDVIGVTAVDARKKVLLEAARGDQVYFAAPGADIAAAALAQSYAAVRGTSFAAPIVAGLLARQVREPDKATAAAAVAELTRQALHPGSRGRDRVYGYGLVGDGVPVEPALVSLGAQPSSIQH